jgi:hypothetical protein
VRRQQDAPAKILDINPSTVHRRGGTPMAKR